MVSESRVASSSPPNPAPRITTCLLIGGTVLASTRARSGVQSCAGPMAESAHMASKNLRHPCDATTFRPPLVSDRQGRQPSRLLQGLSHPSRPTGNPSTTDRAHRTAAATRERTEPRSVASRAPTGKAARLLVARGARVDKLWHASALGMLDRLEELLDTAKPTTQEVSQAFWHACAGGQRRAAERLLAAGADLS